MLELYKRITANSLQVGIHYGSPVLTGRYYASHTIARGRIDKTVREPNPEGEDNPYPGLPLTNAAAALTGFKAGAGGFSTLHSQVASHPPCAAHGPAPLGRTPPRNDRGPARAEPHAPSVACARAAARVTARAGPWPGVTAARPRRPRAA